MTNKELIEKANEYLKSCDNTSPDNWYCTHYEVVEETLRDFFNSINVRGF